MSRASKSRAPALSEVDKKYFDSYSSWHIHEEMIRDRVRTDAYADAITSNGHNMELCMLGPPALITLAG